MRRSSIVAPLLLIAIGVLFLARNLYPELPLIDYLARYWPFLLIAWGVLRLAEVVYWGATSQPLPPHGVSGGEWLLVIFLCIFGTSVHAARGFSTWWPHSGINLGGLEMFGESFEYPLAGQRPTSKTPRVVIESFRGNARIITTDKDEVAVTGHTTIRSLNRQGADRANQDSPFQITGDANNVVVKTNQDKISGNLRVSAELEISVPKGAAIEAHGRTGDFDVSGVSGNVDITSDRAGVRLQDIGGEVRLDLRRSDSVRAQNIKGGVDLKGTGSDLDLQNVEGPVTITGSYTGAVQFQNVAKQLRFNGPQTDLSIEKLPGSVRMPLGEFTASNLVGPVRLTTRSRDVQISDVTNSLEVNVDARGDIELRPGRLPLARLDVKTRSGDIELALPAGAKFELTAVTNRGDVTNDFGDPLKTDSSGRGATLRGSTGGGGPVVNAQTERGQVVIRKSTGDEKPFVTNEDAPATPKIPRVVEPLKKVEQ